MNTTVYILGILLQAAAAVIALLQVRQAPRKLPWLLISFSSLLIVARRAATLGELTAAGRELSSGEILTLIISLLFFLGVILITRMFHEARENHLALRVSEQQYRDMLHNAADAIFINDAAGRIVDVNQKACQSLGYTREELLARTIADINPAAFRSGKPKLWDKVCAGEQHTFEISQMRGDGSTFPAEMSVSLVRLPAGPAMLSIVRDITWRRQAEETLRESEKKYRTLFETMTQGVFYQAADGSLIDANPAALRILGLNREELSGRNSYSPAWRVIREDGSLLPPDEHPSMAAFHTGQPVHDFVCGVFNPRTNGYKWLIANALPQFLPGENKPCQVFVTLHDITERKQWTEQLEMASRRWQATFDAITDPVSLLSLDGTVEQCNRAFADFAGLDLTAVQGRKCYQLIHGSEGNIPGCVIVKARESGVRETMDLQAGEKFFLVVADPVKAPDGKITGFVHIMTDITGRKRAEEALKNSDYRQRTILNNIPDLAWLKDADGTYIAANDAFAQWAGHPAGAIAGKTDFEFSSPELAAKYRASDLKVLQSGKRSVFEEYIVNGKGSSISLETIKTPLYDSTGTIVGIAGIARDITERKRLEASLQRRLVALTSPLEQPEGITFDDLFELAAIQRLQDEFAAATGVASLITLPDGTPITRPSNFCRLCEKIIRCTETGRLNCFRSDARIAHYHAEGPTVQPCLSAGLWNAGASITVGERHIANWLIGQVRDETQTEEKMLEYARAIGADEAEFIEAFREVPAMSQERFRLVAQALFTLANQLSATAYQNIQQARFITERRQAEKDLRQASERLQLACRNGGIGIWELDIVNDKLLWDEQMFKLYGIAPDAFSGTYEDWRATIHPEDLPLVASELQQALSSDREFDAMFRIVRPDGVMRTMRSRARVQLDASGRPANLIGTNHDITKRVQTEEALKKNAALLTEAQRLAAMGSWEYDYASQTGTWSENMARVHDLDPAWSPRSGFKFFMDHKLVPEDRQRCAAIMQPALERGEECAVEYRFVHSDGSIRTIYSTTKMVRDPLGKPVRMIGTAQDITERKASEQALQQKNNELERFSYAVSHDLKSPLVTIQTFLGHLEKDMAGGGADQVSQDLAFIASAAEKMNALLDELLKFSKVGRVINPSAEAPLQEIAQEALALVAGRIDKRGVHITLAEKPVLLYGDRVRLVEVFQNLVDNAVKFMGGQRSPLIEIGAATKDGETECFVRDNGMGIDQQQKDTLFGMFEKLNPEMEGTGMGLALVKRIIEVHGGRVWVESDGPGKGACFWFTLPCKSPA